MNPQEFEYACKGLESDGHLYALKYLKQYAKSLALGKDRNLRDEFALAALTGCLGNSLIMTGASKTSKTDAEIFETLAKDCYAMADAMLEERAK